MKQSVHEIIRRAEETYTNGYIQKSEYVTFNPKADLDKIDAYVNSKFISGNIDELGREKPFFQTGIAKRNITYRATDIDRKNIRTKVTKLKQTLVGLLAKAHLQNWMNESDFGQFLNDWGLVLATYNSAISKHVEQDGKLISKVVSWGTIICDFVDFENNPKIEKLWFTPAQLRQNENYDHDMVEQLIAAKSTRKSFTGRQIDQKADYIEVYEIHGELPLSCLTDKDDDETVYQQQMHIVSYNKSKGRGNYEDFTLFSGREKQDPYMLTSLIPSIDGSISLDGSIKNNFESQWIVNDTHKKIKDYLELALKMFFQTPDPNFMGKNAINNADQGDIFTHAPNQPLTQLNNRADIGPGLAFINQWETQGNQNAGISEVMAGENPPSGTAWRQVQALLQESHSLFKLMRQNKGLAITRILNKFVAFFIQKKMDTTEEISATLESYDIKQIDRAFVPSEAIRVANEQIKTDILSGKMTQQPDMSVIESQIQSKLNELGNKRYIRPSDIKTTKWKDVFKDFKFIFECDPTSESEDQQAVMATFDTALKFIASLGGRPMTPVEELLFNKLMSQAGFISPIELSSVSQQQPQLQTGQPLQPTAQTGGRQVGMAMNNLATNIK